MRVAITKHYFPPHSLASKIQKDMERKREREREKTVLFPTGKKVFDLYPVWKFLADLTLNSI